MQRSCRIFRLVLLFLLLNARRPANATKKKKKIERIRITKVWKMKQTLNLRNKRFKTTPSRYDLFFCSVHFRQKKHVTIVEEEIVFLASFIFCIPSFYFFFIIYTSFLIMCQTLFFYLFPVIYSLFFLHCERMVN